AEAETVLRRRRQRAEHRAHLRAVADARRQMIGAHQRDRRRRQQAHAAEFAAVQQHLAEAQIVGRAPEAVSTCGSATRVAATGPKPVALMPSGLRMRSAKKRSSGCPLATST